MKDRLERTIRRIESWQKTALDSEDHYSGEGAQMQKHYYAGRAAAYEDVLTTLDLWLRELNKKQTRKLGE